MSRFALLAGLLLAGCHKTAPTAGSEAEPEAEAQTLEEAIASSSADDESASEPTVPGTVVSAPRNRTPPAADDSEPDGGAATEGADADDPGTADDDEAAADEGGAGRAPPAGRAEVRGPPPGLEILSNNRWRVPRKLADRWEEHYKRIGNFKQVDDGWRIRVRDQSPGWYLGMRSGDVVLSVNGMKLNNKTQLLAAYLKLKKKTEFEVLIRRGSSTVTHWYTIVD